MSRYESLAGLAAEYSRKADQHEEECRKVAFAILNGYMSFLGCTADKFRYVPLDEELNPVGKPAAVQHDLSLLQRPDGYWYFAFQLELKSPDSWYFGLTTVRVGVNVVEGRPTVRCGTDFFPPSIQKEDLEPLFQRLYEEAVRIFSGPVHEASRRIGFTNALYLSKDSQSE